MAEERLRRDAPTPKRTIAVLAAAAVVYAVSVSFTRPFTLWADVMTALPLAVALIALIIRIRSNGRALASGRIHLTADTTPIPHRRFLPWIALGSSAVAWELYCYFSAPRAAHPTFSSLVDLLDATQVGKSVMFGAWMAAGCYLVLQ